jgi:protein-tyrosine phosphatase
MAAIDKAFTINKIEENIYISSWQAAVDKDVLEDEGIDVVISVSPHKKPQYILDRYVELDIIHHEIVIEDQEPIIDHFPRIYTLISGYARQKSNVLVHCQDGYNISIIAVAAYLMIRMYIRAKEVKNVKKTICDDIIKGVSKRRKHANPLPSYVAALRTFENNIRSGLYVCSGLDELVTAWLKSE